MLADDTAITSNGPAPTAAPELAARLRRLQAALDDLGLLAVTGAAWVHLDGDRLAFATLDATTFDRLTRLVEDLAAAAAPRPAQGSGTMDFATVMRGGFGLAGPVATPPDAPGVHLVVPR